MSPSKNPKCNQSSKYDPENQKYYPQNKTTNLTLNRLLVDNLVLKPLVQVHTYVKNASQSSKPDSKTDP